MNAGAPEQGVRAFGVDAADLDVDFGGADRAGVVTAILERCVRAGDGSPLAPEAAWSLPVGDRLTALVAIFRLSGRGALDWSLSCPAAGCEEMIEIELPLEALIASARSASEPAELEWEGGSFRPRRPTGEDLRGWRGQPPSDADIVATLGGPPLSGVEPPPELVAAVEEALAAADPLVDVHVRSECPGCGEPLDVIVDLERDAVELARCRQGELLRDVAALAAVFGWSERDILALPAWRRRRYLAMVEQGEV